MLSIITRSIGLGPSPTASHRFTSLAVLGDLREHGSPHVEPPILGALRARRKVVPIIGQYCLFESRVLAGDVRQQVSGAGCHNTHTHTRVVLARS